MNNLFNSDNLIIEFLGKVADLLILNFLVLICCIPIITIGTSFTAMYYVLLRIHRNESTYIIKEYFYAFKKNFKESMILWIIYLIVAAVLAIDYYLVFLLGIEFGEGLKYLIYGIIILLLISMTWGFVLLSRYENTIRQTLINSYCIGFTNLLRTVIMAVLLVAPWILLIIFPVTTPIILLLGISLVGYLQTLIFNKVFEKLENEVEQ